MLSHSAILWNAEAITKFIPPLTKDVFLSILPLAHAFERTIGYYLPMMAGSTVAYVRSIDALREDLATIRPTVLIAVPRIYERMHANILAEADKSPLKRALVDITARIGWEIFEAQRHGGPSRSSSACLAWPALKRLVARPIMAAFGGRLRVAVSGGAALPGDVARFLVGMGLPLVDGYGLTEAAPVVTVTTLEESLPGSVGWPLPGLEVRIGDDDELFVRSPAVMLGYWRNPEATSKTLDEDGWLRTGDIARLQEGRVYIQGRLAETIILSTGEKISPTAVEDCILRDRLFEQVCVIGSGRPCLSALIALNETRWRSLATTLNVDPRLVNASEAKRAVLQRISELLADMPKHGIVRAVHLMLEPCTIQNGLLTPTLKIKRKAIEHRFRGEIAALYEELGRSARRKVNANAETRSSKGLRDDPPK
jgi:long-chain acyl-CoA synthetase